MTPTTFHPVLDLRQISRDYRSAAAVHALTNVDLRLERGEWLAITGPSGAGKSTLLNIIGCLDQPTRGRYLFDGLDTAVLTDGQRAGLRSRHIGFVFQAFHLIAHRTVLENVMLTEVYRGQAHAGRRERALAALERVGLTHRANFLPTRLSGGEKQRVAIARALVGSPSLLLCDEPTGNLDSTASARLLDLFVALNQQGLSLVVVTHDEAVAGRAGRRIQLIDGTVITQHDRPDAAAPSVSARTTAVPIPHSRITPRDLLHEAIAGMFARPGRMVLTILGIVIGLTALVATLGLSRTAGNRIISQFDELAATEIIVTTSSGADVTLPWDAPARLARLNGVVAAGSLTEVDIGNALVRASPVRDPQNQTAFNLAVLAASPELYTAVRATHSRGRLPDAGHSIRGDRVAVLGRAAADKLSIIDPGQLPAIAIGDRLYLVVGILDGVARRPDLLSAVIIPEGTARREFGLTGPDTIVVETRIGAAALIARQTPLALNPADPTALKLEVPPEPQRVREAVQSDLDNLFLLLGGLSLVVGAIGIGNITLVSVIERTGEIGLRRAIGARRGHIAAQFLLESTTLGLIGGILGAGLGVLVVVAVSAYQVWTPVLDPLVPLLSPLVGAGIGLVAGTYPAVRAARMEPAAAVRTGV